MAVQKTYTVYKYDELSEKAKERARNWYAQGVFDFDWYDCIYEDAKNIGIIIQSFDCDRGSIELERNGLSLGFICDNILEQHGKDCDTYKLAQEFYKDRHNGYTKKLGEDYRKEFFQKLAEEYLSMLRKEAEYMQSTEYLEQGIEANDYDFTEDGAID